MKFNVADSGLNEQTNRHQNIDKRCRVLHVDNFNKSWKETKKPILFPNLLRFPLKSTSKYLSKGPIVLIWVTSHAKESKLEENILFLGEDNS